MEEQMQQVQAVKEENKIDDDEETDELYNPNPENKAMAFDLELEVPSEYFRICIEAAGRLLDEGRLSFSTEGMRIREMDTSQIAMVDVSLPRGGFVSYPLSIEAPASFGVNLKLLRQFIAKAQGTLKLSFNGGRLHIKYGQKVFTMPLLEVQGTAQKPPSVDGLVESTAPIGSFFGWIKDIETVASHASFESVGNEIWLKGRGDGGEASIQTPLKGENILATFQISFINKFNMGGSGDVSIYLKTSAPLKMQYKFGPSMGSIEVTYWLAPRIEGV